MENEENSHPDYGKIYRWLLVLLVVSIVGPMTEHTAVILITAFGIAVVKALLVCANFMHLNVEKRYIWHLLAVCIVFLLVLFSFVAPDVLNTRGTNWENVAKPPVTDPEVLRSQAEPAGPPVGAPAAAAVAAPVAAPAKPAAKPAEPPSAFE